MQLEIDSNASSFPLISVVPTLIDDQARFAECLQAGVKAAQSGDRKSARNLLMAAVEIDPHSENAWLWLASISEYPEELLVFLNNVLDINPANERALQWSASTKMLLSKTLVQRGIDANEDSRRDFAIQCFDQALSYDEHNVTAWLWLASLADSESRKLEYLRHVLMLEPENETAKSALAAVETESRTALFAAAAKAAVSGDASNALALLDKIESRWPVNKEVWLIRSHLAVDFQDKMASLSRILEIDACDTYATESLASLRAIVDLAGTSSTLIVDETEQRSYSQPLPEAYVEDYTSPTHELPPLEDVIGSSQFSGQSAPADSFTTDPAAYSEQNVSPWTSLANESTPEPAVSYSDVDYVSHEPEVLDDEANLELPSPIEATHMSIPRPDDNDQSDGRSLHQVPMPLENFEAVAEKQDQTIEHAEPDVADDRIRILLVDDSATTRKLIAGKLEACGYCVLCAENGREAIQIARSSSPSLALVDIAMPMMDGYAVCRTLRDEPTTQNVPVVLISGKDGYFEEDRGNAAGASGFITKPFGPETLMKTVQNYLAEAAPNT